MVIINFNSKKPWWLRDFFYMIFLCGIWMIFPDAVFGGTNAGPNWGRAVTTVSKTVINESVDAEDLNVYVNEADEQTIEQHAEEIVDVVRKSYTSYDRLLIMDKARIFEFRIDDNRYNLQLHGLVLKELGLNLYGAEVYEDYQSIYEEMMKKAEKQNADDERRYGDKYLLLV